MSDASTFSIAPTAAPSSGFVGFIAPGLLVSSVIYLATTTTILPHIRNASGAIDVFLTAVLPCLMVIMLLWAARPAAFPQRRRRTLVAVTLLAAVAASTLPMLFPAS